MSSGDDFGRTSQPHDREVTLYLIKQVELAVRNALDEVVATAGLTATQYTALTVLERHPGTTCAELARSSFVRAQTMAEVVVRWLDRGLVTRQLDSRNRRQYRLHLAPSGRQILNDLAQDVAAIESRMLDGFDTGQIEILGNYLLRCRQSLSSKPLR